MAGLQDLQDRVQGLAGRKQQTGWQDLKDRFPRAKLGANYGQDYRMAGFKGLRVGAQLGANYGQDGRITGLQDRLFWLSCGLTMDRMAGLLFKAKLGANNGQDDRIAGLQDLQERLFLN